MKYCVTGGLGFIGNEVVRQLVAQSADVFIIDNYSRPASDINDLNNVEKYNIDICDLPALKKLFEIKKPDTLIHLAAKHFIPECNANPALAYRVNVDGTINMLVCAELFQIPNTIVISSGAVYEDSAEQLKEEQSPINYFDIYSHTKKICEEISNIYHHRNPTLKFSVIRLFNTYGPRETNAHIIPEIISQLKYGNTLKLGNLETRRDFIHVKDVSRGILRIAERKNDPKFAIINLCSGEDISMHEIIAHIDSLLKKDIIIENDVTKHRKTDKKFQKGDISKLYSYTGFKTEITLKEGIKDLLISEGLLK